MGVCIFNLNADHSKDGVKFPEGEVKQDGWALGVRVKPGNVFCVYNYKTSLTCWVHVNYLWASFIVHTGGTANPHLTRSAASVLWLNHDLRGAVDKYSCWDSC